MAASCCDARCYYNELVILSLGVEAPRVHRAARQRGVVAAGGARSSRQKSSDLARREGGERARRGLAQVRLDDGVDWQDARPVVLITR